MECGCRWGHCHVGAISSSSPTCWGGPPTGPQAETLSHSPGHNIWERGSVFFFLKILFLGVHVCVHTYPGVLDPLELDTGSCEHVM